MLGQHTARDLLNHYPQSVPGKLNQTLMPIKGFYPQAEKDFHKVFGDPALPVSSLTPGAL